MKLFVTRDSVAAADDYESHDTEIALPDGASVEDAVSWIATTRYLPSIGGGAATWSIVSGRPIAIVAQQWSKPRMLSPIPYELEDLNFRDDTLRIHANYHAQQDPNVVFEVLSRVSGDGF